MIQSWTRRWENAKQFDEAFAIIEKYEEPLKGENKKMINVVGKQEEFFERFKDSEEFFVDVGLNQSYNSFTKFPVFKCSIFPSSK